ncbi:hypothetical protein HMSSN036_02630 [Paenibacillus macerans]|nr:hypothetical protein HMSSN036_02630 [Paenibacillus macerans]
MKESAAFGIETSGLTLVFPKVQERKGQIVEQLHKGVQYLMRKHNIKVIQGRGRVTGPSIFSPKSGAVAVELANGEMETVVPANLIIATGSRPRTLPGLVPDGKHVLSSDEALVLEELPGAMIIVGGGVIGVEWASLLSDFGVEVTIVEAADQLLPAEDEDVARELRKQLEKRGVKSADRGEGGSRILRDSGGAGTYNGTAGRKAAAATGGQAAAFDRPAGKRGEHRVGKYRHWFRPGLHPGK